MPGPEARYQKKLIDAIRARGGYIVKYPAGRFGTIGTPDLLACYHGLFIGIECKAGNPALAAHAPTTQQERQLDLIKRAGGIRLVAWPGNRDEVMAALDQLDNE
jgi:Holliday junction resolvase